MKNQVRRKAAISLVEGFFMALRCCGRYFLQLFRIKKLWLSYWDKRLFQNEAEKCPWEHKVLEQVDLIAELQCYIQATINQTVKTKNGLETVLLQYYKQ